MGQGDVMWSYEEFISDRHNDEPLIAESSEGHCGLPVEGAADARDDGECEEGREARGLGPAK